MLSNNLSCSYEILKKSQKYKFNVIELFAGCEGIALGLENAGLQTELLVEINKNCCEILNKNRPSWQILNEDVTKIDFTQYKNKVDIVIFILSFIIEIDRTLRARK